jgi:hypothetical protein
VEVVVVLVVRVVVRVLQRPMPVLVFVVAADDEGDTSDGDQERDELAAGDRLTEDSRRRALR